MRPCTIVYVRVRIKANPSYAACVRCYTPAILERAIPVLANADRRRGAFPCRLMLYGANDADYTRLTPPGNFVDSLWSVSQVH